MIITSVPLLDDCRIFLHETYAILEEIEEDMRTRTQVEETECHRSEDPDTVYFRENVRFFSVVRFNRKSKQIVLLDPLRMNLHMWDECLPTHSVESNPDGTFVIKNAYGNGCLNVVSQEWCSNEATIGGHCTSCREDAVLLSSLNYYSLLTLREFLQIPECSEFREVYDSELERKWYASSLSS